MVAAAWATDLTDIIVDPTTSSGWTAFGGGASALPSSGETDFYVQGSSCMSKGAWTNATKGFMYTGGGPWTIPTDGVLLCWALYGPATASLDIKTNGGLRVVIGSASGDYYSYYIGGSDDLTFETWIPVGIDANNATQDATAGSPSGTEAVFGVAASLPTTAGPTKGNPLGMDALRYGRHTLTYTNGTGGDPASTFALTEAYANAGTRRWGNLEFNKGAYFCQGFHSLGSSGTALRFTDSNKVLFIRACAHNSTNDAVSTAYNRFEVINASTVVTWDNIQITALGTRSRGTFVHTTGTWTVTNCQFNDVNTFTLIAASTFTDCIFRRTEVVTATGSDLQRSVFNAPSVTAGAGVTAVAWVGATNPDGLLDGCSFTKGTNAHHAISFDTSCATTIDLNDITFTGFDNINNDADAPLYIARTTGTVTINASGCTGITANGYKTAGATVVIVLDPVTVSVTTKDIDGDPVGSAAVHLRVADATGPYPFEESITIASESFVASVSHTAHGLATSDKVLISGDTEPEFNGVKTITVDNANAYHFTTSGDEGASGGSPVSTFVLLDGTSNATTGVLSMSKTFASNQPVTGKASKASGSPYYKPAPLNDTVLSASGLSLTATLLDDD